MKRILALLAALLLAVSMAVPAMASGYYKVNDLAGILSSDEKAVLEQELQDASDHIGMDVVLLTDAEAHADPVAFADDFYEAGGYGTGDEKSGLILFIDMYNRTVIANGAGKAIKYYTDDRLYDITDGNDELYMCLGNEDYVGAVESCLDLITSFYDRGIQTNQYTYDTETGTVVDRYRSLTLIEILAALGIPALTAFLYTNSVKKQYGMEKDVALSVASKLAYTAIAGFAFAVTADELINHNVTQRVLPTGSDSRGSSSTGNPGRTSVHRSSSGTYHSSGGGGRHF